MTSWMPRREGTPISVDGSRRSKCCEAMGLERWEQNGEGSVPYRDRAYCIGNRFLDSYTRSHQWYQVFIIGFVYLHASHHTNIRSPRTTHHAPRTTRCSPLLHCREEGLKCVQTRSRSRDGCWCATLGKTTHPPRMLTPLALCCDRDVAMRGADPAISAATHHNLRSTTAIRGHIA